MKKFSAYVYLAAFALFMLVIFGMFAIRIASDPGETFELTAFHLVVLGLFVFFIILIVTAFQIIRQGRPAIRDAPLQTPAFDDPVALQTGWSPIAKGGHLIKTHRLVRDHGRLEFRMSRQYRMVCYGLFGAALIYVLLVAAYGVLTVILNVQWATSEFHPLKSLFMATFFTLAGLSSLSLTWHPRVFDLGSGMYWTGRGASPHGRPRRQRNACSLSDIYALQIIPEVVYTEISDLGHHERRSYELNIVLRDGRRMNVLDHDALGSLRDEARTVADTIGCKLWDATDPRDSPAAEDAPAREYSDRQLRQTETLLGVFSMAGTLLGAYLIGGWFYAWLVGFFPGLPRQTLAFLQSLLAQ